MLGSWTLIMFIPSVVSTLFFFFFFPAQCFGFSGNFVWTQVTSFLQVGRFTGIGKTGFNCLLLKHRPEIYQVLSRIAPTRIFSAQLITILKETLSAKMPNKD
uniref:Uncharacterized protein n=1 Tax=Cacopsylla melanoneura TaxID=428564 RepID=A0A8D8WI18_9HEMI